MWDTSTKLKQFRDPLHGYISVPSNYCKKLIDTEFFQRLRGVEQTSMRPLYPAARHDRFIHSLGVYHLACLAFHFLKRNTSKNVLGDVSLDRYKNTFLIAALMHDCGHAPFSHLFEGYYNSQSQARKLLLDAAGDEFKKDYISNCDDLGGAFSGAPHEEFSAYLLIKHFSSIRDIFKDFCPVLAARMITGCIHNMPKEDKSKLIENCLIKLINGDTIDVDKLDYIMRDTWTSGVNNVSVDVHRLLAAIELVDKPEFRMVYNKSALSVIQNVIEGRNFLYRWIYTHHTVLYNNYLLTNTLEEINSKLSIEGEKSLLDKIFSPDAFEKRVEHKQYGFYLPCDGDIYYLMKSFADDIPNVREIISRCPSMVPLWKTYAEFKTHFTGKMGRLSHIKKHAHEYLAHKLDFPKEKFIVLPVKAKYVEIDDDQLFVQLFPSNSISYTQTLETGVQTTSVTDYFYVYIPIELYPKKKECIEILKSIT